MISVMRVNKGVEISSEAPSTPEVSTDETVLLIENYPPNPLYFPTYCGLKEFLQPKGSPPKSKIKQNPRLDWQKRRVMMYFILRLLGVNSTLFLLVLGTS